MKRLSRYNPANNLYIKVFLWFWIGTIIMVSSSAWIINKLNDEVRYRPIRKSQMNELRHIGAKLQKVLARKQNVENPERLLSQIGMRYQIGFILVEPGGKNVLSGLPRHMRFDEEVFFNITPETPAISINSGQGEFFGPGIINFNDKHYMLFIGKPTSFGFFGAVRRQHPAVMLSIALSISAILCFLFARSLVRPIRQLQYASQQMAAGDLSARVGSASKRHDEIGHLGRDFNIMSQKVEILLSSQKRLLADISHELRSPLARLQLSIGIVQQQAETMDDDFLRTSLDRIEKEAAQIEKMIAQVLMLSRLDNPQALHHKESIDIQSLLSAIISDAQFEAQEQHKEVVISQCDKAEVVGDAHMLSSAIENVLRNAVKYAHKIINMRVYCEDSFLHIVITDDG
ncbi:HAMP domain-containing protein, partial [Paraglaciecola sp.]|uniref:HAMP domain-containing protein n=1 Tax=Paraglaciecola sp. TaxID=1920173 RepID=UPI0030F464EA